MQARALQCRFEMDHDVVEAPATAGDGDGIATATAWIAATVTGTWFAEVVTAGP